MTEPNTKARRREKKNRLKMKITGKQVFALKELKIHGRKKMPRHAVRPTKKPTKKG